MKEMNYVCDLDGKTKEILHEGEYKGYYFYIISYGVHPCAYVEIKPDHPWYKKDYCYWNEGPDDISNIINCHGGLTYSGNLHHVLGENDRWFLGWDYGHAGDFEGIYLNDIINCRMLMNDKKWTTEEIYEEVRNVIDRIVAEDLKRAK